MMLLSARIRALRQGPSADGVPVMQPSFAGSPDAAWNGWGFGLGLGGGPGSPSAPWASPDDNGDPSLGYRDPRWHQIGPPDGLGQGVMEGFYYPGAGVNMGFAAPFAVAGGMFVPGYGVINSGGWYGQEQAIFDEANGGWLVPGFGIIGASDVEAAADQVGIVVDGGTYIPGLGLFRGLGD